MAEEIAQTGSIHVRRPNREELLRIRSGAFDFDELQSIAKDKMERIDSLFNQSHLPERPDQLKAEALLVKMREAWYAGD
jgi:hypothetical protein